MEDTEPMLFPSECSVCGNIVSEQYTYCTHCGFPQNGTKNQVSLFHANTAMEKNKNMDADKKIRNARNTLYVMAGISFVFGLMSLSNAQAEALLLVNFIQGIIYLVLGSWSNKKPLIALLLGLFLYLTIIIVSAVADPSTLVRGIIFKVIIIAYLGRGIYSALSIKTYNQ